MRTVDDVLNVIGTVAIPRLPAPPYSPIWGTSPSMRAGLSVPSMQRHSTNEGWELFRSLSEGHSQIPWDLFGHGLPTWRGETDVRAILEKENPDVVLLQDKREWEGLTAGKHQDPRDRFHNVGLLRERNDVFKLTVLKDAQSNPHYHRQSADEIGCHAWVIYYHPRIVTALAPYVRPEHLIRTWHTIDPTLVPPFQANNRGGCILSGALSGAYPLRMRLYKELDLLPNTRWLKHPGYHRRGCETPDYLKTLSHYKVSICTSSKYGYALRKIVESTACGCIVVTDLPVDEVMPEIDENLVRISPNMPTPEVAKLVDELIDGWDMDAQEFWANVAKKHYDWRAMGKRLSDDIETMRRYYIAI